MRYAISKDSQGECVSPPLTNCPFHLDTNLSRCQKLSVSISALLTHEFFPWPWHFVGAEGVFQIVYSCVSVWQNDHVETIANDQGNYMTPSYVSSSIWSATRRRIKLPWTPMICMLSSLLLFRKICPNLMSWSVSMLSIHWMQVQRHWSPVWRQALSFQGHQ